MSRRVITPVRCIRGEYTPPGDKSISHRLALIGSICRGTTTIHNPSPGLDYIATLLCLRDLGVDIEHTKDHTRIRGGGLYGYKPYREILDAGNSATTMRLISGILSGQPFSTCLSGDASLRKRPMARIVQPLCQMGAQIDARKNNYPPLIIRGGTLHPIRYKLPIASAQVKSAILLAGLYAGGITEVLEPRSSRNHTELMLKAFGAVIAFRKGIIRIQGGHALKALDVYTVPGDFSTAAFWIAAAAILPGSDLVIRNVNLNPTRTGLLDVLQAMGGSVEILDSTSEYGEIRGDLRVRCVPLKGTTLRRKIIGRMIDELPLVALLGIHAEGHTLVKYARELRVKESDRIQGIVTNLRRLGVTIDELPDGFEIEGPQQIRGGEADSQKDHRLAMTLSLAGLCSSEGVRLRRPKCVEISNPAFFRELEKLVVL